MPLRLSPPFHILVLQAYSSPSHTPAPSPQVEKVIMPKSRTSTSKRLDSPALRSPLVQRRLPSPRIENENVPFVTFASPKNAAAPARMTSKSLVPLSGTEFVPSRGITSVSTAEIGSTFARSNCAGSITP